ncbi:MAG: porin [Longimicrobiaceae bacterium]
MTKWKIGGVCTILILCVLPAPAQEPVDRPVFKVNAMEIAFDGRAQTQFNTSSVDDVQPSEIILRRLYLGAAVKVNELVSGKVQVDFAGSRVSLKDAYLKLSFSPGLQLLAGNAYKPFSLLTQTSDTRILPVERGVRIRGLNAVEEQSFVSSLDYGERDIGVQLLGAPAGAPLGLEYAAGIFRGPLQGQVGPQDSYQFAARVTGSVLEETRVGVGWSSRDFMLPPTTLGGDPELERGNAFEIDAEYGSFASGLHFLGELAWGDFDAANPADFVGAQGWFAYRTPDLSTRIAYLEPTLRLSYGDLDGDGGSAGVEGGTLLTPGFNLGFGGLNRLMLNYDVWLPDGAGDTESSFKAMFQLAF